MYSPNSSFLLALQSVFHFAHLNAMCADRLKAYAAKVRTGDCTDFLGYIQTLNGVINVSDLKNYNNSEQAAVNDATARCRMVQAETAFLWILVVCYVGTIVLAFFGRSGNKDGALV